MLWVSLLEGPIGKIHETSLMSLIIRILKIYLCKVGAGWKRPYGTQQGLKRVADIIIKMVSMPWVPNACNNFLCYLFFCCCLFVLQTVKRKCLLNESIGMSPVITTLYSTFCTFHQTIGLIVCKEQSLRWVFSHTLFSLPPPHCPPSCLMLCI